MAFLAPRDYTADAAVAAVAPVAAVAALISESESASGMAATTLRREQVSN